MLSRSAFGDGPFSKARNSGALEMNSDSAKIAPAILAADFARLDDPIFKRLASGPGDIPRTPGREKVDGTAELGYLHCGPNGRAIS
jgi:hypothetical protein